MNRAILAIALLILPTFAGAGPADVTAVPTDAPMANLVQVVVPDARWAAVSDVAGAVAFACPQRDKPGDVRIFGLDAKGNPIGTPAEAPPAAKAGQPAPPPPPLAPLFTVQLPRPASLAKFPHGPRSLLFHPTLPLLYVWQDIAGPKLGSAKDNIVFKEFDHLLVYSLAAGQPPKLELATARGPGFAYGQGVGTLAIDPAGKRLFLPNLRSLASGDRDTSGAIGYVTLDEIGMPVRNGDELAMTVDNLSAHSSVPSAHGCAFISDTVAIFGGVYGPTVWDRANRRGTFGGYFYSDVGTHGHRLVGHPTLPQIYVSGVGTPIAYRMEHVDGYLTLQPQKLTITGSSLTSPPVPMPRHGTVAFGAAGQICVARLDAAGNFTPTVTRTVVKQPSVQALAYSEKFDRLYVAVEEQP